MEPDWSPSTEQTRRSVLQTGVAALATGTVGTAAARVHSRPATGENHADGYPAADRLGYAPADTVMATYGHVGDLLADPAVQAVLDAEFGRPRDGDGPTTLNGAWNRLDELTAVSLDDVEEALQLWIQDDDTFQQATVFWTNWARADVLQSMESVLGVDLGQSSYRGYPRYQPQNTAADGIGTVASLGVLGDGTYVIGTTAGVNAVLDVVAGDAEPVGSPVRPAFGQLPGGPAQFALDVPPELLRRVGRNASGSLSLLAGAMRGVTLVSGAMTRDGDSRRLTVNFEAESPRRARIVTAILREVTEQGGRGTASQLFDLPVETAVSRSETTTTVAIRGGVDDIGTLAEGLLRMVPASALSNPFDALQAVASALGFGGAADGMDEWWEGDRPGRGGGGDGLPGRGDGAPSRGGDSPFGDEFPFGDEDSPFGENFPFGADAPSGGGGN